MIQKIKINEIEGFKIGHSQNFEAKTGCTVVLCEDGAVAGFDLRGSAPGTRETELLRPGFLVEEVHGVLLTGGSAFGLDAAGGVQKYLEERDKGYDARGIRVPIVPSAVIFDLKIGNGNIRPDFSMAYQACENANSDQVECGQVGVGTGATVGKILGMEFSMAGGVGYASEKLGTEIIVSAVVVVNALGDIVNPQNGDIVAGAKDRDGKFADTVETMKSLQLKSPLGPENTTLAIVMTNAKLDKIQINKVAQMAQNGLARTLRPVHTMYDGDLIFSLSKGSHSADVNVIGEIAADCVSKAIIQAIKICNGI
jgi:L-aminopeptidase/D-esterase-like protein